MRPIGAVPISRIRTLELLLQMVLGRARLQTCRQGRKKCGLSPLRARDRARPTIYETAANQTAGRGVGFIPPYSGERDLEVSVGVAPEQGDTSKPVFCVDQPAHAGRLLGGKNTNRSGEFGSGDLSAHGAGSDPDLRMVADALVLSQLAAGHEVKFVVVFGKPDGRVHSSSTLPEGSEADVTLAVDRGGDGSHEDIVNNCGRFPGGVSKGAALLGACRGGTLPSLFNNGGATCGEAKPK